MSADRHELVPEALRPLSRWLGRGYRRAQHALRNMLSKPQTAPVFVLGNQKSGTSAIAALLARACGRSVALDMLMEVNRPLFQRVPSGALSFADYVHANRWEFSHDIVKEPNLTFLYPELARAFPDSRVVFILRDPRDNIRSLLDGIGIPGDLARLQARHTEPLNAGWRLVLDGSWCGIEGEHYIDQLAARWNRCAEIYCANREKLVLCRYEDFRSDKLGEVTRLAGAVGLAIEHDVSGEVDRQYQTRGNRSVSWEEFFGSENLARIEVSCESGIREFGYSEPRMSR